MTWHEQLNGDTADWPLEQNNPDVRYLTLRDICGLPADDVDLKAAQEQAHHDGPISIILDEMDETGFWAKPGAGYNPNDTEMYGVWGENGRFSETSQ